MQLLGASITPNAEFVSLSLLVNPNVNTSHYLESVVEHAILVSPSSTVSESSADLAIFELHNHLTHVIKASSTTLSDDTSKEDSVAIELLRADEILLTSMQIYRPSVCHGFGLYYRIVYPSTRETLFEKLLSCSMPLKSGPTSAKVDLTKIHAVVLVVGISGLASAYGSSPLEYSLSQRVRDCFNMIEKVGIVDDMQVTRQLLSSFLLWKDEASKSNTAIESRTTITIPEHDDAAKSLVSPLRITRNKLAPRPGESNSSKQILKIHMAAAKSAETSRAMVDRMTLLSVSEPQTLLRPYDTPGLQRRANLDFSGLSKSRFRRRKGDGKDADFDGFDFKGHVQPTPVKSSLTPQTSRVNSTGSVTSSGKPPKKLFKGPQKDTRTKVPTVPALSAPRTDAQVRRKNKLQFDDDASDHFKGGSSVASVGRIQVNIALNEDLSCFYKESQLTSCNVEGIMQVSLVVMKMAYRFNVADAILCVGSAQNECEGARPILSSSERPFTASSVPE